MLPGEVVVEKDALIELGTTDEEGKVYFRQIFLMENTIFRK